MYILLIVTCLIDVTNINGLKNLFIVQEITTKNIDTLKKDFGYCMSGVIILIIITKYFNKIHQTLILYFYILFRKLNRTILLNVPADGSSVQLCAEHLCVSYKLCVKLCQLNIGTSHNLF